MGNQATVLRPEAIQDLEDTTFFTAEEIRQYYREFMKETSSGRMTMSVEEFKQAYVKVFPNGDASKFAEHVFRNFDVDNNGRVDFREFLSALSVQQKGTLTQKLEWTFDLYDLDNSGFITRDELVEMCKSILALNANTMPQQANLDPAKLAEYIMAKSDENKDEKLTKDEFITGALNSQSIQKLLVGTVEASGSSFTKKKNAAAKDAK